MSHCAVCGTRTSFGAERCERCSEAIAAVDPEAPLPQPRPAGSRLETTGAARSDAVVTRYRDGYRVATLLVGAGEMLKAIGVVLGMLLTVIGIASLQRFGGVASIAGVLCALVVGGFFFVCGVMISAQGQLVRATLDGAVAASPFLTDDARAEAMGLGDAT